MNNFQELRSSQSHQALPSYAYSIPVPQPYPIETAFSFRQNQSTLPLSFNSQSPFKPKLRKAPRPKSRGQQQIRIEHQDSSIRKQKHEETFFRVDSNRMQLEQFSKTSSSMWDVSKISGTPPRMQGNKLNSYVFDSRGPYGLSKQNMARFTETKTYKHVQSSSQDSKSLVESGTNTWKIVDAHSPALDSGGSHTSYLLQEIQLQRKTIESFQQEILRLNQELVDLRQKVPREGSKWGQDQALRQAERIKFLQADNQKLKQQLDNRQRYNTYLQAQCKQYIEATDKKALDLSQLQQTYYQAKIKIEMLQEQSSKTGIHLENQEEELRRRQAQLERTKKQQMEEIDRLNRLVQAQTNKLNETEKNSQLDRSQISMLMMKLQGLIDRNTQLKNNSEEASRWRGLYEQAEKEMGKKDDACRHLQQQVTTVAEKLKVAVQELSYTKNELLSQESFWKCQTDQLAKQNQALRVQIDSLKQSKRMEQNQRQCMVEQMSRCRIKQLEIEKASAVDRLERTLADCHSLQTLKKALEEELQAKDQEIQRLSYKEQQLKEKYEKQVASCQFQNIRQKGEWSRQKVLLEQQLQLTIQNLSQIMQQENQLRQQVAGLQAQLQRKNIELQQELKASRFLITSLQIQNRERQLSTNICAKDIDEKEIQTQDDLWQEEKAPSGLVDLNHREKVQYIQVDFQGLKYICELLGCQSMEQGILNSIVQNLVHLLRNCHQRDSCLSHLLEDFDIACEPGCEQKLIQEIDSLRQNIFSLLQQAKQLENIAQVNDQSLQKLTSKQMVRSSNPHIEKSVSFYQRNLQELNQDLNSEVLLLRAVLFNYRLVARNAIGVIQQVGVVTKGTELSTRSQECKQSYQQGMRPNFDIRI